ncbi:MAG: hypothetical protein AB1758_01220 [Candidatus Eremiobacterota bacterium]
MFVGIAVGLVCLWLFGLALAARRPEVVEEASRRASCRGEIPTGLPHVSSRVPALVSTGNEILSGTRHSAHWKAPNGARLSMN